MDKEQAQYELLTYGQKQVEELVDGVWQVNAEPHNFVKGIANA